MQKRKSQETLHCTLTVAAPATACQLIAETSGLPKERIKHAMAKGAVWLTRPGKKERRLRKAKFQLREGDSLQLFYDRKILAQTPIQPTCIAEHDNYSVWFKPAWLLSQGTRYGDHCSLLRLAEKDNRTKDYKLIHRLDREASGLIILAHDQKAAKLLSNLFRENKIEKRYIAEVSGNPTIEKKGMRLTTPIDGKSACTEILSARPGKPGQTAILDILLHTGRLHQIRRHLAQWGYPIVGDQEYGDQKTGKQGELHLCAWKIAFLCPFTNRKRSYHIPPSLKPAFLSSG